jgi:hypothetical protein
LISEMLTVHDVSVDSRPIEEIIAEVYKEYSI